VYQKFEPGRLDAKMEYVETVQDKESTHTDEQEYPTKPDTENEPTSADQQADPTNPDTKPEPANSGKKRKPRKRTKKSKSVDTETDKGKEDVAVSSNPHHLTPETTWTLGEITRCYVQWRGAHMMYDMLSPSASASKTSQPGAYMKTKGSLSEASLKSKAADLHKEGRELASALLRAKQEGSGKNMGSKMQDELQVIAEMLLKEKKKGGK
jgi:hypothetical protein